MKYKNDKLKLFGRKNRGNVVIFNCTAIDNSDLTRKNWLKKNRDFWLQEDSDDECEDFQDVSNVGSFRSYVWKHFLHSNLRQVGKCKMCGFLSKCNQGNTSGMGRHLKQKHPTVLEQNSVL